MEIWKDIPGYEGLYKVSDCGQVKSCERVSHHPRYGEMHLQEIILKPHLSSKGYYRVRLRKNGNYKTFYVHRLVALAFLDADTSLTVNHIDECKTNNHVSNLEYLTRGDNIRSWNKNNPERRAEINKLVHSKQVLDTRTGKIFPSIKSASLYMHEEEGAKGPFTWSTRIQQGKVDRFIILDNSSI